MTHQVTTQWTSIRNGEGSEFDAFLALPPSGSGPGIVLFQEIFGVNGHIQSVAAQYAQDGFVVLAPDLFWRQKRRVELGYDDTDRQAAIGYMKALKPEELQSDIQGAVAALRARPETAGRKVGALGYCLGGRLAFVASAISAVDAAVAFYGGGIQDQLALAPRIKCPIQFHYGGKDESIPASAVEKIRDAVSGKSAEFHTYPEASHGFNCWDRGAYHPASAALSHGRSTAFLAQQLF